MDEDFRFTLILMTYYIIGGMTGFLLREPLWKGIFFGLFSACIGINGFLLLMQFLDAVNLID